MKIRLGMTFPLLPNGSDRRKLTYALPAWGDTNFTGAGRLADSLPITDLRTGKSPAFPLNLPEGVAWAERATVQKPLNLVVMLDSSEGMATAFGTAEQKALRTALENLPPGSTVRYTTSNAPIQSDTTGLLDFSAGHDNVARLTETVKSKLGKDAVLLYLHSGTPDSVSDPAPLAEAVKALSETPENRPRFVSLLLKHDAPDTIGDRLAMQKNARSQSAALYSTASEAITATIEAIVRGNSSPKLAIPQTTPALKNLQAYQDVLTVWYQYNNFGPEALKAARIVAHQGLITPLSGAVVLENHEDYKKQGLEDSTEKPNDKNVADTPSKPVTRDATMILPEPATWLLMACAIGVWIMVRSRHRRTRRTISV